jgi:hypothetical protein
MPTGYTHKRRIGSMFTDGSAQWLAFTQYGDDFRWKTTINAYATTLTASPILTALATPLGLKVKAEMCGYIYDTSVNSLMLINSPDETAVAPNSTVGNVTAATQVISQAVPFRVSAYTDTSSRVRAVASGSITNLTLTVIGWTDTRGKI